MLIFASDLSDSLAYGDAAYHTFLDMVDAHVERQRLDLPPEPAARAQEPDPRCLIEPIRRLDLRGEAIAAIVQTDVSGVVVANANHRIVNFSGRGRQLLDLSVSLRRITSSAGQFLPEEIRPLVKAVSNAGGGAQPFLRRDTPWGAFTFTAYRLTGGEESSSPLAAIHIEYLEPLRLQIARGALKAGLSRRQSEICVLLAENVSQTCDKAVH